MSKRRKFFKIYIDFTLFTPKPPPPPPLYWGSWNLKFLVSSPYRWYIPNIVKIHVGLVVLEENMLMVGALWMTLDANP